MSQTAQEQIKCAVAELLRAILASSWFWQRQQHDYRRNRLKLDAVKSKGNALSFVSRYFPDLFSAPDPRVPKRGADAVSSICRRLTAFAEHPERAEELTSGHPDAIAELIAFLSSLTAQPGRKPDAKYDEAARLRFDERVSIHGICQRLYPEYRDQSFSLRERRRLQSQVRSAINRRR